jgi:pyruvate dehydrogenase E1 component
VAEYVGAPYTTLGTDGFGRSDTRAALRRFFEVDRQQIVLAALDALRAQGRVDAATCAAAIVRYAIAADAAVPWGC